MQAGSAGDFARAYGLDAFAVTRKFIAASELVRTKLGIDMDCFVRKAGKNLPVEDERQLPLL